MRDHQHSLRRISCLFTIFSVALSAPKPPLVRGLIISSNHTTFSGPNICRPGVPVINSSAQISIDHTTWTISDSLSLVITICNWEPSPVTIVAVLAAALEVVGKKPATGLLDRKFTQRSQNKYNTLYFEISPDYDHKRLMWADVGEVLGSNGLPKFFETTHMWHTVYFDVKHSTRGIIGEGAIRRWWQLEPPNVGTSFS